MFMLEDVSFTTMPSILWKENQVLIKNLLMGNSRAIPLKYLFSSDDVDGENPLPDLHKLIIFSEEEKPNPLELKVAIH